MFISLQNSLRLLLLVVACTVIHSVNAQMPSGKYPVQFKQATLSEVFRYIRSQTGFSFFYSNQQLNDQQKVNLQFSSATTDQVLKAALGDQYSWTGKDKTITITKNQPGLSTGSAKDTLPAQTNGLLIHGQVVNEEAMPLAGASINIKGSSSAVTISDGKGNFQLRDVTGGKAVLEVSYVGYQKTEIPVPQKMPLTVTLKNGDNSMTDVVVIGYGAVNRKDLTGSVAQVNMEDLNKAPVASFTEALAGRIAGVQVSSNDGQPGVTQEIIIRGANSLTQSNAPLYVIDGFPVEDLQAAAVNNEDIESINILKDASATAIYGARAANGVVVITTKKGKAGKMAINFSTSQGFQSIRKKMDMMTPYDFVEYNLELKPQVTQDRYLQPYNKTLEDYRGLEGVDWQDAILANTPITSMYNLSLRGGNAQTKYNISGSIFDQDGILRNSGFKRYQGRIGIDQTISTKLKAGVSINYSRTATNGQPVSSPESESNQSTALLYRVWGYRPVAASAINLLEEESDPENLTNNEIRLNPVITNDNEYRKGKITDIIANAYLEYKITRDLTFRATGALNSRVQRNDAFYNSKTTQGSPLNPLNTRGQWGSVTYAERNIWINENTLNYNRNLRHNHKLNLLAGFSMQQTSVSTNGYAATLVPNEELGIDGLDEGTPYTIRSSSSRSTLVSVFGRANYSIDSRFLFTATLRGDGSSKFAPGYRWGYFPSGAFAWNVGEEKFLKNNRIISSAKIRTSYGVTGNNRVADFAYLPSLMMPIRYSYSFNNGTPINGVIPNDLGNAELKWESTAQLDAGIDLGFFKERINLTVDLYRKNTSDLLFFADVPFTSGYEKAYRNIGKIRNEGIEISLNTTNINKNNFRWESSFNISFNRNKILALSGDQQNLFNFVSVFTQYNNSPLYLSQVGQPAGMFYGYIYDGVYQYDDFINANNTYTLKPEIATNGNERSTIQPGDIKYRDLNGDGVVDAYDQAIIGNGMPKHVGGFTNNFRYKNFQLSIFFQWSYGNNIYNANRLFFEGNTLLVTDLNQYKSYMNRWSPDNQTNANFRAGGQGPAGRHSSRVLEDGSYLRLKTFSFGYDVPAKYLRRISMKSLNINLSAQNLLTWTNYSGMDPEVSVRNSVLTPGFDYSAYPHARTVVFGIRAGF
ncbi:MAG: TonB-dependent receptor [Terrimonas ferruginea]|uniref:TonB-dependent receptor n=1 Tax=Terrimonas ferruginea TaxID=249 RepID=UPI001AD189B5|nr:TonB-dependent receptor [Terrimonas ferruginea]MBN8784300.1 TonB-dependent receptor [Terrimonas ferruginea]